MLVIRRSKKLFLPLKFWIKNMNFNPLKLFNNYKSVLNNYKHVLYNYKPVLYNYLFFYNYKSV